jgi:hypothetical protein
LDEDEIVVEQNPFHANEFIAKVNMQNQTSGSESNLSQSSYILNRNRTNSTLSTISQNYKSLAAGARKETTLKTNESKKNLCDGPLDIRIASVQKV